MTFDGLLQRAAHLVMFRVPDRMKKVLDYVQVGVPVQGTVEVLAEIKNLTRVPAEMRDRQDLFIRQDLPEGTVQFILPVIILL